MTISAFNLNAAVGSSEQLDGEFKEKIRTWFKRCSTPTDISEGELDIVIEVLKMDTAALNALSEDAIKGYTPVVATAIYFFGYADVRTKGEKTNALLRVTTISGDPSAMGEWGEILYQAEETRLEALEWFAKAAKSGDEESHGTLANLLKDEDAPEAEKTRVRDLIKEYDLEEAIDEGDAEDE